MSIITISRGSRSGGQALAEMLAGKLGYDCVSREILVEAAEKYGVEEKLLVQSVERPPKFWERFGQSRKLYLTLIRAALLDRARNCKLVYHGYAGQFLLKGLKCVLKVRLIAPLEYRIKLTMEKEGFNREEAIQYIQRVDNIRSRWTKFFYGVELADPAHYDLVINLETMTLNTACDLICALTEKEEFQANLYCLKNLKDMALAAKVEAAFATDIRTKSLELQVAADSGTITLKGGLEDNRIRQMVLEVTRAVDGVKSISDEITMVKLSNIPT